MSPPKSIKPSGIISLLTDFGVNDGFAGVVEGVIYRVFPEARVVHLTHNVPPHDKMVASMILASCYKYFPTGTVHCAIVDPNVGGKRDIIIVENDKHFFIAPDNGLLTLVLEKRGIKRIGRLKIKSFLDTPLSNTFHGRDLFAPAAALLSKGVSLRKLTTPMYRYKKIKFSEPKQTKNYIKGCIIYFDTFGNAITNIKEEHLRKFRRSNIKVYLNKSPPIILPLKKFFTEVRVGTPLAYIGSYGYLECAINNGSFKNVLSANTDDGILCLRVGAKTNKKLY